MCAVCSVVLCSCSMFSHTPILQLASIDPSPAASPGSIDSDAIGNNAALDVQRRVSNSDQADVVSKPSPLVNGVCVYACVCVCVYVCVCVCMCMCVLACACLHVYVCVNCMVWCILGCSVMCNMV